MSTRAQQEQWNAIVDQASVFDEAEPFLSQMAEAEMAPLPATPPPDRDAKFSPDQPRDDHGLVTGGGAEGARGPRDVVIIGAGPAGLMAAIESRSTYGKADSVRPEGLDTLLIDANTEAGGQARLATRIEDYVVYPMITGERLAQLMFEDAHRLGAETKLGVRVTGISYDDETGLKTLKLSNGEEVQARGVIIASGIELKKMFFPGSESPSVIYADGKKLAEMAAERPVVVIGSNWAAQAALWAARTVKHVTVISRSPIEESVRDSYVRALRGSPEITIIERDEIKQLNTGPDGLARQLVTKNGRKINTHAVGIFIGGDSDTKWLPSSIKLTAGKVATDENLETSMPGVFAAGDIREGAISRILAAVREGQVASINVLEYFNRLKSISK